MEKINIFLRIFKIWFAVVAVQRPEKPRNTESLNPVFAVGKTSEDTTIKPAFSTAENWGFYYEFILVLSRYLSRERTEIYHPIFWYSNDHVTQWSCDPNIRIGLGLGV